MQAKLGDGVIVAGRVTADAKYSLIGEKKTPKCSFSLMVGKNKDTTTIFVNCEAWRGLGEYAAGIRKGDAACVIGRVESHEYNGKTYTSLVADWLNYASVGGATPIAAAPPSAQATLPEEPDFSDFEGKETDLPF